MEAYQESMAEKKARNQPKRRSKTHRFANPSRTCTTPPGISYLAKMDMMLKPALYPHHISSSSSLPRLDTQYSINRFHQPPLLPLPMASSSSASCEFANKLETECTKHPPIIPPRQLSSTCKAKKCPDPKPGHGGLRRASRLVPAPETEKPKDDVILIDENETKFYESLIYAMSPSPSSLPMPKFAILKPKLTT